MEISPESHELSLLHHFNDMFENNLEPLSNIDIWVEGGYTTEEDFEKMIIYHLDDSISGLEKILNHPHSNRLGLKAGTKKFIDRIKNIKNNYEKLQSREVVGEIFKYQLQPDFQIFFRNNREKIRLQDRFNNVEKYEGFEEALTAIGHKRRKKRKTRKRKINRRRRKRKTLRRK